MVQDLMQRSQQLDEAVFNLEQRYDTFRKNLDEKVTREDVRKLT